jgi:hypothetical protein
MMSFHRRLGDRSMPFYAGLRGRSAVTVPPGSAANAERLLALKAELAKIPQHSIDQRVLIATWNIREFDSTKGGLRGIEPLMYIAEIISASTWWPSRRCAIDLAPLNRLLGYLGSWWDVLISDVTCGQTGGNTERLAFLYDSAESPLRRARGRGGTDRTEGPSGRRLVRQFARTPFLVGFQVGWRSSPSARPTSITARARTTSGDRRGRVAGAAPANQTQERHAWAQNVLMLGDFNIFKPDEKAAQAIAKAGFHIPPELTTQHTDLGDTKHYDQIAWLEKPKSRRPGDRAALSDHPGERRRLPLGRHRLHQGRQGDLPGGHGRVQGLQGVAHLPDVGPPSDVGGAQDGLQRGVPRRPGGRWRAAHARGGHAGHPADACLTRTRAAPRAGPLLVTVGG